MNSGCSASNASASWLSDWRSTMSCHHTSRPSVHGTSVSVRRTTSTCWIVDVSATAWSVFSFIGAGLPRRNWPSEVISSLAWASSMRAFSALGEKPPNTTLCVAPRRAQASMATTASGIIGSWMATRSPVRTPELGQRVGGPADLAPQVGVGDGAAVAGLALPVDRDLIAVARLDMAVDAVGGHVERAADEPLRERRVPLEDLVPLLGPGQPVGLLRPEALPVLVGAGVPVLGGVGLCGELRARREAAGLGGKVGKGRSRVGHGRCLVLLVRAPRRGAALGLDASPQGRTAHRQSGQGVRPLRWTADRGPPGGSMTGCAEIRWPRWWRCPASRKRCGGPGTRSSRCTTIR